MLKRMNQLLESLRDVLTIRKLADEVPMNTAQRDKVLKLTEKWLEALLPESD